MNLGEIVKEFRKSNKWSMDYMAEKAGVSKAYISMLENGSNPRTGKPIIPTFVTIQKLASAMHMTTDELVNMMDSNETISFEPEKVSPSKKSTGVSIPLYGPICCGNGGFVDDNLIEMISLPADVLKPRRDYFAQRAKGDSMIGANIHDGDILVFEKSSTIENGQIGCFCLDDNEAVCKRYRVLAGGQICLMPENPDYSPILIDVTFQNFRCIGLLIVNIENMVGR